MYSVLTTGTHSSIPGMLCANPRIDHWRGEKKMLLLRQFAFSDLKII
jgi:hypothetical protein